jgi:hypothetical protein
MKKTNTKKIKPLYIEARYRETKEKIAEVFTKDYCKGIINRNG